MSAPHTRPSNINQLQRSHSESEWLGNKGNVTNGSIDGDKGYGSLPQERKAKSDLGVSKFDNSVDCAILEIMSS